MGRRCGCVSDECSCAIVAGRGISFSGTGNANNPLIVATTYEAHAYMQGRSSHNTDVNLTGSGTGDDPYTLSVDFNVPEPRPLPTSAYTSPGTFTWVRPSNTTMVDVWCIGAGASGTPGNGLAYEGGYTGGTGGAGGAYSYARIVLPNDVVDAQVRVGQGGFSVPYYDGSYSNRGGESWVTLRTASGPTNLTVYAAGGSTEINESAPGTHEGQYARVWYSEVPYLTVPSGGAGGGGGGGVGDTRYGRDGGYHLWFSSAQRMAGDGGAGGDARNLTGAGINYNGLDGGRGAGGGGGGAPSASEPIGGNSGAGGNGAVWIVSI